jgi:hypothetical protein
MQNPLLIKSTGPRLDNFVRVACIGNVIDVRIKSHRAYLKRIEWRVDAHHTCVKLCFASPRKGSQFRGLNFHRRGIWQRGFSNSVGRQVQEGSYTVMGIAPVTLDIQERQDCAISAQEHGVILEIYYKNSMKKLSILVSMNE